MFLGKCLREETSGETAGRKEGKGKEERRKDQRGNRWTQGGKGRKEGGDQRGNRWTQGGEGEGGKEEGGELTLINTIIKKT